MTTDTIKLKIDTIMFNPDKQEIELSHGGALLQVLKFPPLKKGDTVTVAGLDCTLTLVYSTHKPDTKW